MAHKGTFGTIRAVSWFKKRAVHHLHGRRRGQILLEVLIAIGTVAIVSSTIATLVVSAQRAQENARRRDIATNIVSQVFAAVSTMVGADSATATQGYNRIYCPPDEDDPALCPDFSLDEGAQSRKGSGNQYRPVLVGNAWLLSAGAATETTVGIDFTHSLIVDNVCRIWTSGSGWGDIVGVWAADPSECTAFDADAVDDPGTQRIIATVTANQMNDLVITDFVTRSQGNTATQTDWSGASVADTASGGSVVTFTVNWTDPDMGERVMAHICKTNSITEATQTCDGGSWADSASFTTNPIIELSYVPLPAESGSTYAYYVYICDDDNGCNSPGVFGEFIVN